MMLEGKSIHLKGSQLAIGIIHIDPYSKNISLTNYDMRKKKINAAEILMDYGEEVEALMEWNRSDEITFITTRRNIEKSTKGFSEFPLKDPMIHELI